MDQHVLKEKITKLFTKYRFALLILAVGLVLMALPEKEGTVSADSTQSTEEALTLAQELEQILSQIEGAGKVRVLLTTAEGERTQYQTDSNISGDSSRQDTVIITDSDRKEEGLITQVDPPVYQGAIIVCQGADRGAVRLAIVEAVSRVTGLGADRISVLKMK